MTGALVNGASLWYSDEGRGEPVVLVHGSASDHRTWTIARGEFAEHFRTITYSRRYHWPNERIPPGTDYSLLQHVDDLEELLRVIDMAPAHLVGHSYGALICMLLAARAPQLVRSLVLAEPPAVTLFVSNIPKPREILRLLVTRPRTAAAIIKFGAKGVAPATAALKRGDADGAFRTFSEATLGRGAFRRVSQQRREQGRANFIEAELLGSGYPPLDDAELSGIQLPTLLLHAEESPSLFRLLIDRLEELIPKTERTAIPRASHIMHEDNPEVFNTAVLSFLRRNGAKSSDR